MLGVARHRLRAEALFLANYSASGSLGNGANAPGTGIITMDALPTGKYRIVLNGSYQVQTLVLTRQVPATLNSDLWVDGPTDNFDRGDRSEVVFRSQMNVTGGVPIDLNNVLEGNTLTDYTFDFTMPLPGYEADGTTTLYWIVQNIQVLSSNIYTGNYNLSVALYQI